MPGATTTATTSSTRTTMSTKSQPPAKSTAGRGGSSNSNANSNGNSSSKGKAAAASSSLKSTVTSASRGSAHPTPATTSASASSREGMVRLTMPENLVHNAILACNRKTMLQSQIRNIEGLPSGDDNLLLNVLNQLLRKSLIKTGRNPQNEVVFVAVPKAEAREISLLDPDEKIVLDHVSQSHNQGIWTRTLKARSGLHQTSINRAIKTLEQKRMIKNIKSVKFPTRKIYMLEHVVPSIDVTGGPWYAGNELDTAFIDEIAELAKKFIKSKSFPNGDPALMWPMAHIPYLPTANDILDFMQTNRVLQVDLNVEHISAILDMLVFDGDIERIWTRRYDADGISSHSLEVEGTPDFNAPGTSHPALPNGNPTRRKNDEEAVREATKKRKTGVKTDAKSRKKRRRERSTDSADIDDDSDNGRTGKKQATNGYNSDASTDSAALCDQMSEDEDFLPHGTLTGILTPPDSEWSETQRAHKRPGPAGNDWYWVHRTCLTAIPVPGPAGTHEHITGLLNRDKKPITQKIQRYPEMYELGFAQTPCGVCPVAEFCNNRGKPRTLPLPGERDLSASEHSTGSAAGGSGNGGGTGGVGGGAAQSPTSGSNWRQSAIVRQHVRALGYNGKTRKAPEAEMRRALLQMKVPAGSGKQEDADGVWKGGGKVGGTVVAPVNPSNCVYYAHWFGEEIDW